MLRRIARFLAFAIEPALSMHARPPESVRRLPRRLGRVHGAFVTLPLALLLSAPASAGGFGAGPGPMIAEQGH